MKYTEPGTYHLVYKAVDECGNESEKTRTVVAEEVETEAYAKFNSTTTTLTFFRDEKGKYVNEQVIGDETFYTNVESQTEPAPPWANARELITRVVFEDDMHPVKTEGWFQTSADLTEIVGIEKLDTSNVTDMGYMFYGCSSLTSLDVSSFNTSNVTDMGYMFSACSSLTSLDLSSFNTSNVVRMANMFSACSSLTSLDLSSFNTSNVTNMEDMFSACRSLTSLDLSSFNTSNVGRMANMFSACSSLTSLDLSSFNTSNVTNMANMFVSCRLLKTIYASDKFVTTLVPRTQNVFPSCTSLVGGAGTTFVSTNIRVPYARIDNPPDAPGYFTRKE